ncbi:MAG: TetR family transcriptional regulator [Sphingomonas sp.]|uniref:TetR/AcrR family transcriptional regulator n=1 Tax=Sphingomonas sp. TaxID=28214 RepID=UPI0026011B91|nr:TetR/AcrR family transcriptional regulator [Sphingomonas sp.]MBQ1499148.1 TetR family transcriptional regulator [Sphingomonas sp.]
MTSFQARIASSKTGNAGTRARRHPPKKEGKPGGSQRDALAQETRERLLDAAEELFATHGLYGTTVRAIAGLAGVDTALIHYYFGTKRELFDTAFLRRSTVVNRERTESLKHYIAGHADSLTVEGAIEAFLEPLLTRERFDDPGWRNHCALAAQISNTPEWGGEVMTEHYDGTVRDLLEVLKRALPGAEEADIYWCYQFLSGSLMSLLAATGRIDRLSGGLCRSGDVETFKPRLIQYAASGARAVCGLI